MRSKSKSKRGDTEPRTSGSWRLHFRQAVATSASAWFLLFFVAAASLTVDEAIRVSKRQHWSSATVVDYSFQTVKGVGGSARNPRVGYHMEARYAYRVGNELFWTSWTSLGARDPAVFFDPDNPADYTFGEPRLPYAKLAFLAVAFVGWLTVVSIRFVRVRRRA